MNTRTRFAGVVLTAALLAGTAAMASAETLRWTSVGDGLTLDPHAQNETPTHRLNHQIYETLLHRDMTGQIVPSLATDWAISEDDPNVWIFNLRQGVTFHDGSPFDAEDVIFSIKRAQMETSNMGAQTVSIVDVRAPGDHIVELVTDGPNPLLPANLTNIFIMDKQWSEANNVTRPQDFAAGEDNHAVLNGNGTGPFRLISREPDTRTVLAANGDYWGIGQFPLEVRQIIHTPIQNDATRIAALLSGEVDFMQDVPVQDIGRVADADGFKVRTAPQNRTIFFGINVGDDDLANDSVEGVNPFADLRVRQAMNMAIDREAIRQVVMRGQSQPAGVIIPPFVNGWTEELDAFRQPDVDAARALMADAGYGDGFSVTLHCPNDRYINDEPICQAMVGMMGQIGIDVDLVVQTRSLHFPVIANRQTDFYMLGWGDATFDSANIFNNHVHTEKDARGAWNGTRFSDPDIDTKIQSLSTQTDLEARDASIAEIWDVVKTQNIFIPIHHQVLTWGMRDDIVMPVQPENMPHFKYLRFN